MLKSQKWIDSLIEDGMTEYEIACGITNGDLELPEGILYGAIDSQNIAVYDEDIGSHRFIQLG